MTATARAPGLGADRGLRALWEGFRAGLGSGRPMRRVWGVEDLYASWEGMSAILMGLGGRSKVGAGLQGSSNCVQKPTNVRQQTQRSKQVWLVSKSSPGGTMVFCQPRLECPKGPLPFCSDPARFTVHHASLRSNPVLPSRRVLRIQPRRPPA